MIVALLLALVVIGTVVFHILSPWWWTPIASNWGYVDDTIIVTFWITGVVFIIVGMFVVYCVYRYRHQEGRRAAYEPENTKLEVWLTALTTLGVAGMLAPGLFVWNQFVQVPDEAYVLEAVGQQWQWHYRLPGKDGALGKADNRNVTYDNPVGIDPDDPWGQDDIVLSGVPAHIELDQPIKFNLRSRDVLHDFYVSEFRAKMDMVPGMVTFFWFIPTRTGTFDILCFELCGTGHYAMRGKVVVEEEGAYQAWLDEQSTFAELSAQAGNRTGEVVTLDWSEGEADSAERRSAR